MASQREVLPRKGAVAMQKIVSWQWVKEGRCSDRLDTRPSADPQTSRDWLWIDAHCSSSSEVGWMSLKDESCVKAYAMGKGVAS